MNTMLQNKKRIGAGLFALLLAMLNLLNVQAQSMNLTEIIIGEGTETSCILPFNACSASQSYGIYSEFVYTADQLPSSCLISNISFDVGVPDMMYSVMDMFIYMGTTTNAIHTSETDWLDPDEMSLVLTKPQGCLGWESGWATSTFELDSNFYYSGGDLVIGVGVSYDWNTYPAYLEIRCTEVTCPSMWTGERLDPWGHISYGDKSNRDAGTLTYLRPNIKLGVFTEPLLISSTDTVDLGNRPSGYWMAPKNVTIINEGLAGTITSATIDNSFFQLNDLETPYSFSSFETIPYSISSGTGTGTQTGTLSLSYGDGKTLEIPLKATAYTPQSPDVWEMAREVSSFPYTETITTEEMTVYDNYQLPGNNPDGNDVVYQLEFDYDVLLTANITNGDNGKCALYQEGFEGKEGPTDDCFYSGINQEWKTVYTCDFEDGSFNHPNWVNDVSYPWLITNEHSKEGSFCMKSGNSYVYPSESAISFTIDIPHPIIMSFWAKISSNYDIGCFYIDGEAKIDGIHGDGNWEYYSYEIEKGTHTFTWYYRQWASVGWEYDDCFYVDNVVFGDIHNTVLNSINEMTVPSGTYYLVASSTSDQYSINIHSETMPEPVLAEEVFPHNNINLYNDNDTISLTWLLGDYTKEFQLLFGETNPPTNILVDWTSDLAESYPIVTEESKTYYWCVNERNSNGITYGTIWKFSTYKDIHADANNIIYVTPTGSGIQDGSSWENAASNLQVAMDHAGTLDEKPVIWVSKGSYYLWNGKRDELSDGFTKYEFYFISDFEVKVFGGFNGNESPDYDLNLRDFVHNPTILDSHYDCSVVMAIGGSEWDGFVFQNGKNGNVNICGKAALRNCKIIDGYGDGLVIKWSGGSPVRITNCQIKNNSRNGILQELSYDVNICDSDISYNSNIGVYGNCNLIRCRLCNNGSAAIMRESTIVVPIGGSGGTERIGGTLVNCLVANNNNGTNFNCIYNSTIVNNGGGGITSPNYGGYELYLSNNIIWGNSTQIEGYAVHTLNNNAIQGGLSGSEFPTINLSPADDANGLQPGFNQPSEGIGASYSDGDWSLSSLSPCINMGSNNDLSATLLESDLAGNARIQHDCIDLGAYESDYAPLAWDTISDVHCEGVPYDDHGFDLPAMDAGDFAFDRFNSGESSFTTLLLHVNPKTYSSLVSTMNGEYELNGFLYTEPGIYTQILPNQYECDSVITLYLVLDDNIVFADETVKSLCVQHWDTNGDGELSYFEAANVFDLGQVFQNNTEITSFEELQYFVRLATISDYAFNGCNQLTGSLIIPNSVTSIGEYAFNGCSGLTGDSFLPSSLTFIGQYAFSNCSGLTGELIIPNSVTSIGQFAFRGCSGLTGRLFIPSSVSGIGDQCFMYCRGFTSLELPHSIECLGNYSFAYCGGLVHIISHGETPSGLLSAVFTGVNQDIPVYVPCGSDEAYNAVSWGGFSDFRGMCPGEVSVTAEPSEGGMVSGGGSYDGGVTCTVSAIPNEGYFFMYWTVEGNIISSNADYSFIVANDLNLVANFCKNDIIAFADENVKNICIDRWDIDGDGELSYSEAAAVSTLDDAFGYNRGITSFDELQYFIRLTAIKEYEFAYCSNLASIAIPISVISINSYAFLGCNTLASIVIPNSVTSIGWGAFERCHGLTSVVIPSSVKSISNPFTYCTNLLEITVDSGNAIYDSRDNGNAIIATATNTLVVGCVGTIIPNTVSAIGNYAFYNCGNLNAIAIPNSVGSIGSYAFTNCGELAQVIVHAETPPALGEGVFEGVSQSIPVYVPCGSEEVYDAASWGGFSDFREMCAGVMIVSTNTLAEGWNWWTPIVEATLEDLEAGLGTHGIIIKTQTENVTYEDGEWMGDEITLTPGQMYKIKVDANCSFTLSGSPASSVTVTINPGSNWIGYPGLQAMSIIEALNGFTPAEGDVIKTATENTTFEDGEWMGDFDTLQPGQGYIYISRDTEGKSLTF